ncbi:hypothetical protein BD779DRAFT_1800329 [Infundibulicybe gibba]|nr:hypothetical protein BD779DRAFT_1800329 [Infundibulicybe gibba]
MSPSSDTNYAKSFGFESVAAVVIFAILYMPLLGWFVRQSVARPTYVTIVRVTAFIIRAVLSGSDSVGHNLNLLIGDEIHFGVGFAGLLYSSYTLVLDRMLLSDSSKPTGAITRLIVNRIFRVAMIAAVALGIADPPDSQHRCLPRPTILQAYQTLRVVRAESGAYRRGNESWGVKHGGYILCAISLLLLIREAFATATSSDAAKQNSEHFWYPLTALPEILAVALYATPGLVPPRSELPT